jgi:Bacterial DNA-binding protein
MAKAKPAKSAAKTAKPAAKKAPVALLSKPKKGEKSYTKSKLVAHLATAVSAKGFGEVSKKQAAAFIEEFTQVLFAYAPVGAPVPGLGKVLLREIPAKPARTQVSFGKEIKVAAKPKSQKIVFRFSKEAKDFFKK